MKRTIFAYNFTDIGNDETEISIYDKIASKKSKDYWTDEEGTEVTPTDFKEQLNNCKSKNITIRMNSGGGEVTAANVIAVAIQEAINAGKNIVCKIDGMCASAAVQIAMACEKVIIHKSALMMIHNPMAFLFGYYDINEMGKAENLLKATKDSIINYYTEKTGMTKQKISNMMDDETYMTGIEAVNNGFADSLMFDDEDTDDEGVINNISKICAINQALNIPTQYKSAINNIFSKGGKETMEIKTVDELKQKFPTLTDELAQKAVEDHIAKNPVNQKNVEEQIGGAVEAERNRIKAIDELAGKVDNDLLAKAKYETLATAENVAMEAIKTGAFVQSSVLNAMQTETAPAQNVAGVEPPAGAGTVDEKKLATEKASNVAENYFKSIGKAE